MFQRATGPTYLFNDRQCDELKDAACESPATVTSDDAFVLRPAAATWAEAQTDCAQQGLSVLTPQPIMTPAQLALLTAGQDTWLGLSSLEAGDSSSAAFLSQAGFAWENQHSFVHASHDS